jgi:phage repressor protein C with HTH and peptisase S24 domain
MEKITNPVVAAIAREAEKQGLTLTSLAAKAGLSGTTLTKKANASGAPNMTTLRKVAQTLGKLPTDFLCPDEKPPTPGELRGEVRSAPLRRPMAVAMPKDLPVMGTAAGATLANGFEITSQIVEYVRRPPALEGVPDAYAIYVVAESMSPLHRPGDLCIVHRYRPYKRGDSVIVQIKVSAGAKVESYIKTFKRQTADELVVEQINPKAEIAYKKSTVISVHKVMTLAELFGV